MISQFLPVFIFSDENKELTEQYWKLYLEIEFGKNENAVFLFLTK